MPWARTITLVILATIFLPACDTMNISGKSGGTCLCDAHAEQDLAKGVKIYEEGDYTSALATLQHALQDGLSSKSSQARAYKYMAFIHCVSGREKQCRDTFKKALEIDPDFDLQTAEAGHPVWGPVFRSIKGGKSAQ